MVTPALYQHVPQRIARIYSRTSDQVSGDKTFYLLINYPLLNLTTLADSPPFRPSVLKPRFHLSISHFQCFGQSRSFSGCQIFLFVKPFLQFRYLESREGGSWFLSLRRGAVLIRVTDPSRHGKTR